MRWVLALIGAAFAAGCRGQTCPESGCVIEPFDAGNMVRRDVGLRDGGPDAGIADAAPGDARPAHDAGGFEVTVGQPGRILLRGLAVLPMNAAPIVPGEVYVEGNHINCVGGAGACAALAQGATSIDTGGVILPALIDVHNHPGYNWLPTWVSGRFWDNSGHWRGSQAYADFVAPYRNNSGDRTKFCAMMEWGEIRSLAAGTTTLLGAGQARTCYRWLVRNAELGANYNGFGTDRVRANTLGIDLVTQMEADSLVAAMTSSVVAAYFIHLAEGVDDTAHNEFIKLKALGLLRRQTVIIHGTALTPADFAEVAAAGAKIVWSPSSNLALYGQTTDVAAASAAGVTLALAPDWTPSGTGNVMSELRFASAWLSEHAPALADPERMVSMVTTIPAQLLGEEGVIGSLVPGALADVLVLSVDPTDPYRSVIAAHPEDVRLVLLDGHPSYGDAELVRLLPDAPPSCSDLDACSATKRACWIDSPDGQVTTASITGTIQSFYSPGPLSLFDCR